MIGRASVLAGLLFAYASVAAAGTITSTYLGNARRTAYVDAEVPAAPVLQWVYHEKHPPRHAWPEPNREVQYIDFDYATQVAIADGMVFFGSSADHQVYAIDVATGAEKWTFHTEGPVRFAPVVRDGRVYAASDDGHLYCLKAATGREVWRFRGGPGDRKLIGNEQMISHWPARSGVLIEADRLYFTAGMWSRDGVFIYCLAPGDGSVIWKNDTAGYHFATLPHSTGYADVAPQGYLVLHRGRLYVPTGRGAPAAFDAATGDFQFYENGLGYKPHQPGGSRVMAWQDWVIFKRRSQHSEESVRYEQRDPAQGAASGLFAIAFDTGKVAWSLTDKNIVAARDKSLILAGQGPVIKADVDELMAGYAKYFSSGKNLGHDKNIAASGVDYTKSGRGKLIPNPAWMSPLPYKRWQADVGRVFVLLCAGDTILAGGRGTVSAIDFQTGEILWRKTIDGEARGICVVDGRFIVSSTAGKLYCFGSGQLDSDQEISHRIVKPTADAQAQRQAADILQTGDVRAGYALMLGVGDGQLLAALVQQGGLIVYCLEPDAEKVAHVRKILSDAGLLGVRAAVHHGPFDTLPYNPYFANLIVWGEPLGSAGTMRHTFIVGQTLFLPWAFDLHTGEERLLETHPLTGRPERFSVSGKNFCGTISAACDLLIYRPASIGFAEIRRDSGSHWLPESRPSCWISAIPAGGMVLAPEGYSTCICPYNYKTSLAMIPVQRNENWSVYLAGGRREKMAAKARGKGRKKKPAPQAGPLQNVRSLRVNFNAPGDQMDAEGRLWLAWPRPVDPKNVYLIQPLPVQQESKAAGYRLNADYHPIADTQTPWLYTSGLTGPLKFTVRLSDDEAARYNVALHFAETDDGALGQRAFEVKLQDKTVISRLDVAAATGGANRALIKEFRNMAVKGTLTVELVPVRGKPPLICSLEVLRQ